MSSVGIKQLEEDTATVLHRVKDLGDAVDVTESGRVIARIVPVETPNPGRGDISRDEATGAVLDRLWRLGDEISREWPEGSSAVDAIRDVRRDL